MDTVRKTVSDNYHDLSKGGQIIKKVILASNVLVLLFGLLLVIVGGVAAGGQIGALTSTTLASGVIVIGVLIMLIAILGCWGAMTENKILLYIYFSLLVFFAVVEFAVGIAAYVKKDDLPTYASQLWTGLYQTDRGTLDNIETSFQCCGWDNVTDRSVPPIGNEATCASLSQGAPSCSVRMFDYFEDKYGDMSTASREFLQTFQQTYQCCGWTNLVEQPPSYWVPYYINSSATCADVNAFTQTCYTAQQNLWYANYYYVTRTEATDNYIIAQQSAYGDVMPNDLYDCCGWANTSDAAVPTYYNLTCSDVHKFTSPCSSAVDNALSSSYQAIGGIGVAIAVLQIATIILTLVLIVKIPPGGSARRRDNEDGNAGVMEELHDED